MEASEPDTEGAPANTIPRYDDNMLKARAKVTRLAIALKEQGETTLENRV